MLYIPVFKYMLHTENKVAMHRTMDIPKYIGLAQLNNMASNSVQKA